MVTYDEDPDSGDISLSLPVSHSSPQLSLILRDTSIEAGPSTRQNRRLRDLSSPTPQRLFGKGLWAKTQSFPESSSGGITSENEGTITPSVLLGDEGVVTPNGKVPAKGWGEVDEGEGGTVTPLASASFWAPPPRSSSAAPPTGNPSPTPAGPSSTRPGLAGRTSSTGTLTRSRSLNVRPSSVDMTVPPGPSPAVARTPSTRVGWSRRPGEPRPPPLINEEVGRRMGRWIKEIVVCNFDLERGPVVERRIMGRRWGPGEKENVAFSSFPDTSLFTEGSILFSFKIRHIPPDPSTLSVPEPPSPMPDHTMSPTQGKDLKVSVNGGREPSPSPSPSPSSVTRILSGGEKAAEYRKWDERGREWLYGYVWFEQRRDKGIARGYMQKSLVILTQLPFPSLFSAVLHRISPVFFEHGYPALEAACHSIASWPDPSPDTLLKLPLLSETITVQLPDTDETPQVGQAFGPPSPETPILASLPPSTPLRTFATFLPALWSLWECLVLAEPVLVIAPDPRTCSEIVWCLRDLLRPIPPAGDFRPYLHIHDHDFSLLVNSNKPQAGIVLGVTNPFFRNAASHWPNVISIPSDLPNRTSAKAGAHPSPSLRPVQPEGFISRRQRNVQKDRVLLKRLEGLVAEGRLDDPVGNEAIRTHFQQLTERMLVPLNRYFQTLVPTLSPTPSPSALSPLSTFSSQSIASLSASTAHGTLKPFSLPAFLTHLKNHGPNPLFFRTKGLSTKSRVENDFYASFCMSPTFAGWLAARIDSLGLAVAAQSNNSLAVPESHITPRKPGHGRKAYVRLGFAGPTIDLGTDGRTSPSPRDSSETSGQSRLSSDGSIASRWAPSEGSPRSSRVLSIPDLKVGPAGRAGLGGGGTRVVCGEES